MCRSARKDKAQKACVRACVRACVYVCVCVRVCAMHRGEMNVRFALRMGNTPHLIGQDHVGSTEPSVCEAGTSTCRPSPTTTSEIRLL